MLHWKQSKGEAVKRICVVLVLCLFFVSDLYASQSSITEAEGYACMGEDRTKRQTESVALQDAKRKAVENVSTHIQSETQVKDFELQKDIVSAYANAKVKIISSQGRWNSDPPRVGDCYRLTITAEIVPNEETIKKIPESKLMDDPSAPLRVQAWTEKKEYKNGEKMKIFVKGNKPFFAKVLYKDAGGGMVQILPNPFRQENYFQGGVIYAIPSGKDRFELNVEPPFGEENIVVYASTAELGEINLEEAGGVYRVRTAEAEISIRTRGVKITGEVGKSASNEFYEENIRVRSNR
jgi:hypothetical protein